MYKRFLSLLLSVMLAFSTMSTVLADEISETNETSELVSSSEVSGYSSEVSETEEYSDAMSEESSNESSEENSQGVNNPSAEPTASPVAEPTLEPTATPTVKPTATPTVKPTATPTVKPTATPTVKPTATPTVKPTATPTVKPTATPTVKPTATPTVKPTATPTVKPTATPKPLIASGTLANNIRWKLDKDGKLTISGSGDMYYYDYEMFSPWSGNYRDLIKTVEIEKGVTSLPKYAFYRFGNLRSVILPDGIKSIGDSAFYECPKLKSITIPYGVKSIGYKVFRGCSKLKTVSIPNSVKSIGYEAFDGCTSLENLVIPESVTEVDFGAFFDCSSLTSVDIPSSITSIPNGMFFGCNNLKRITVAESVTYIGYYAFPNCNDDLKIIYGGSLSSWREILGSAYDYDSNVICLKDHKHSYKSKTTKKATLTANGKKIRTCKECGYVSTVNVYKVNNISLDKTRFAYDGSSKMPTVIVKNSKGNVLKKDTDYVLSYPSVRKNVGRYKIKVTLKGDYQGSSYLYFDVVPKSTTIKKIAGYSNCFRVYWNTQKNNTSGYQIIYSKNPNFSSYGYKTVSGNSNSKLKITGFSRKTTYYVKIRTYKTVMVDGKSVKLFSSWSSTKSVKTK